MSADTNNTPLNVEERFNTLERQMADSQRQISEISSQNQKILDLLSHLSPTNVQSTPAEATAAADGPEVAPSFVSRRSMLRKAAFATLGAAAVFDAMPSARASNSAYLNLNTTNSGTSTTKLSGAISGSALYVNNTGSGAGIFGMTTSTSSAAISGSSQYTAGVKGVSGMFDGVSGTSTSGYGVYGSGLYGGALAGSVAPLYLYPNSSLSTPYSSTLSHLAGELFVDSLNELWYCTVPGTPGTWRKVAGSGTAGSFAVLSAPTRFIDTRVASSSYTGASAPAPGGSTVKTYIFSGANAVTPYGTNPPSIPYGATSLVGRLTVLNGQAGHSTSSGQVKVSNVNPPGFGSGLVIWSSTAETQILPFVLALDNSTVPGSGQMYFENTSTSDTIDIIVDVTGYYY